MPGSIGGWTGVKSSPGHCAFSAWPGVLGLGITFVSWGLLLFSTRVAMGSAASVQRAFADSHIEPETDVHHRRLVKPFSFKRPGVQRIQHV